MLSSRKRDQHIKQLLPDYWLDCTDKSKITSTSGSEGVIVDVVTSKDVNAFSSTALASGALANKPRFNREGYYFRGNYGFTVGAATDWTAYHNGTAWTAYIVFKQLPLADTTLPYPLIRTSTSSSQVGFSVGYYNRSATSNQKTFQIFISNGSGGTAQFLINGTANQVVDNAYNILKIKFSGTALTAWVKTAGGSFVQIGTDATGSVSTSAPANTLNFASNGTGWKGYLKHVVMFKRTLSAGDESNIETFLNAEMYRVIQEEAVNVYISGPAQSNYWGRGANGSIASDLNGKVGAFVWYPNSNTSPTVGYWTQLQVGVSSNPDFGETVHGFNNRFGYQMVKVSASPCYILAYGVSSTRLKSTGSVVDWNTASVEAGDLYPKWKNVFMVEGLEDLKHVMRKTPVFRGMVVMQGEQDATLDGTTYKTELETWIKTAVDQLISYGYDCTKMRIYIFRINNKSGTFLTTPLADVRAAQVSVATQTNGVDFSSYIPSKFKAITWSDTDSKSMNADNLHYSASGVDSMGTDLYNYFSAYINES